MTMTMTVTMSTIIYAIVTLLIVYLIARCINHFTYWQRQGIPSNRFIDFSFVKKSFTEFIWDDYLYFGKLYGVYGPGQKGLIVNDARLAREFFIKEFHKFPRRDLFHIGSSNIKKSLFFMEANHDWARIRSIVTPAFTAAKLKGMFVSIDRIAKNFIEHIRPHSKTDDEFDLKRYIGGFTMDVIACCGYGIEIDSINEPNHPMVMNAKKILNVDMSLSTAISFLIPSLGRWLQLEPFNREAIKFFDDLTFRIVEKRMQETDKQKHDLLGLMIENSAELYDEKNSSKTDQNEKMGTQKLKGITKEELSGQGILFFIAGFDTTHATIDHMIYYLSKNPEWQEKLYCELVKEKDTLDYEKLKELPILNAVINETLRLNPPLSAITRVAKEEGALLDTGIKYPKNTFIGVQPYVMHRIAEYFPDPLVFKPERFLDESQQKLIESNHAYIPFGVGARFCVGMRFALNELRIFLSQFVLNYVVKPGPNLKLEYFRGSPLMSPKQLMVIINER